MDSFSDSSFKKEEKLSYESVESRINRRLDSSNIVEAKGSVESRLIGSIINGRISSNPNSLIIDKSLKSSESRKNGTIPSIPNTLNINKGIERINL